MEKTLRVLGGDEDAHGHGHSHSQPHVSPEVIKNSSIKGSATVDGPRNRNIDKTATNSSSSSEIPKTANGPSKLSAYLNLFGDFVHNMSVFKTLLLSSDDLIPSKQYRWIGVSTDVIITTLCNTFFAYPGWPHPFTPPLLSVQPQLWPVSLMKSHMKLPTTQS